MLKLHHLTVATATALLLSACSSTETAVTAPRRIAPTDVSKSIDPAGCAAAPSGAVALYRGEGDATDAIGHNDGTVIGPVTYAPGMVGQGFSFVAVNRSTTDERIVVPYSDALGHDATPRTYMLWFSTTDATWGVDQHTVFHSGAPAVNQSFSLDMDVYPNLQFYLYGPQVYFSTGKPKTGWMHFAATYDGSTTRTYINGVFTGSYTGTLQTAKLPLEIGNAWQGLNAPYLGVIDEFTIFNRALSQGEVQSIANAGSAGMCLPNSPPTASFPSNGYSTVEGTPVAINATASDADNDALTYKWDIDNDGVVDSTNTTGSLNLTFADNGSYPVKVTVDDGHGHAVSATTTLTVTNAAPVIATINPATSVVVGGTFTLAGTFSDAGTKDGPWTAAVDWGDHTSSTVTLATLGAFGATHVYPAYGSATVSVTITDKDGAASTASTVVVHTTDTTAPVVSVLVNQSATVASWYNGDVAIQWSVADVESGIASSTGCDAVTVSANTPFAGTTYTCSATNGAGLASSKSVTIKRDATPPSIAFSGNAGNYAVDQSVAITCSASDALSGLASSTCADVSGAAYTFALDHANTYAATATDMAGNSATATASFTVSVSDASVCSLVKRLASNGGVANSLCTKLVKGNYDPFRNELAAQTGKKISTSDAATLLRLVNVLDAQ